MIKLRDIVKEIIDGYQIYCDLDGVLADFDTQFKNISGGVDPKKYEDTYGSDKFWKLIGSKGINYWSDMPLMQDATKLWNTIKRYNPQILTAIPQSRKNATTGKHIWVAKHLGQNVKVNAVMRSEKQQFANAKAILIDDKLKNIQEWEQAGGIGIHHKNANSTIAQLKRIKLNEMETVHAGERYATRFETQPEMTSIERVELNRRYDALKNVASQFKEAAIMLFGLDRIIFLHPERGINVPLEARESNGDTVWAVIRDGKIATIFARRSDQGFDYWQDITRGDVKKENIWYMTDRLVLKKLRYSPKERVKNVVDRKTDFAHNYSVNEDTGGATMNLQDMAKHNRKLKKLKTWLSKQGDRMLPYPNLKKTVMGVPWKQLIKTNKKGYRPK